MAPEFSLEECQADMTLKKGEGLFKKRRKTIKAKAEREEKKGPA